MKKSLSLLVLMLLPLLGFTQDKPAYILYNQQGKKVKYQKMLKTLLEADIVFFGELHTDPIAHWLQVELTQDLFDQRKETLVLGAEMFEADNQLILDEYLKGIYEADKFEAEMRLWGNYQTDYKPLVEFARENQVPFIATNIPRRYASLVHKKGFEGLDELTEEALRYIAPLPINYDPELKCYKDIVHTALKPALHAMPEGHGKGMPKNTMQNLPRAQAAKDATMAHFILENWTAGQILLHFNGTYHSDNFQGIVWHLKQQNPDLNILTIATVQQDEIDSLDEAYEQLASYILCIPENMTRTKR